MTAPQDISDRIWDVVLRAAERDHRIGALLFAQPDVSASTASQECANPGSAGRADLLSGPLTAQAPAPIAASWDTLDGCTAVGAQGGRG